MVHLLMRFVYQMLLKLRSAIWFVLQQKSRCGYQISTTRIQCKNQCSLSKTYKIPDQRSILSCMQRNRSTSRIFEKLISSLDWMRFHCFWFRCEVMNMHWTLREQMTYKSLRNMTVSWESIEHSWANSQTYLKPIWVRLSSEVGIIQVFLNVPLSYWII